MCAQRLGATPFLSILKYKRSSAPDLLACDVDGGCRQITYDRVGDMRYAEWSLRFLSAGAYTIRKVVCVTLKVERVCRQQLHTFIVDSGEGLSPLTVVS